MATPSKRKRTDTEDVIGFLHKISPVKTGQSGKAYFNMVVRTETNTYHDGVCYCPDKHSAMVKFSEEKTPVRLREVHKVPSFKAAGCLDIKMDKFSLLDKLDNEPTFKVKPPTPTQIMTVKQLKTSASKPEFVTLDLKILSIDKGTQKTNRFDQLLVLFEVEAADVTDHITLNFWGNCRHSLKEGSTYRIVDLKQKVKTFNETISVSLGNRSELIPITDFKTPKKATKSDPPIKGQVAFVSIKQQHHCGACLQKINYNDRDIIIRCPACKMAQRATSLQQNYSASLQLVNNLSRFSISTPVLMESLSAVNKQHLTESDTEEFILGLYSVTIYPAAHNTVSKLILHPPSCSQPQK